ncbi:hypothetical protein [Thioalkalivibrio paradoxus]|uniref:Uncharacterized protein n=1 Tax=Thioalkalivibrio paradoxus ARh 1 TaxID=713585 RepID=W0DST9_9GAMM|nr:hypothetical protein [Thioalkalivibrio paradoxus]AHF00054.1 hypothetical protein THITH_08070 [Thioalkalivibrio paradoxus ARh 1]
MTFKVGELVIMQNASYYTEWNGALGVVVSALAPRTSMDLLSMRYRTSPSYRVKVLASEGIVVDARPHQLRRLRGPEEPVATTRQALRPVAGEPS